MSRQPNTRSDTKSAKMENITVYENTTFTLKRKHRRESRLRTNKNHIKLYKGKLNTITSSWTVELTIWQTA